MDNRAFTQTTTLTNTNLHLALAPALTPHGTENTPTFFDGTLHQPRPFIESLRLLGELPKRTYTPHQRTQLADPILSAHGDCLAMEAFSACNSVYARIVYTADAFDNGTITHGTTNVDITPLLDSTLRTITPNDTVGIRIGTTGLDLTTKTTHHTERPVKLPERWIRGLANASALSRTLTHRCTLDAGATRRLLTTALNGNGYLHYSRKQPRLSPHPLPGSTHIHTLARIELLRKLAPYATGLNIYGPTDPNPHSPTAVTLTMNNATATFVLTPHPARGFSGEGALLTEINQQHLLDTAPTTYHFSSHITPNPPATTTELETLGIIGWDLNTHHFFHRQLPPNHYRNHRLEQSHTLTVDWIDTPPTGPHVARIKNYRVEINPDYCTCEWFRRYETTRGPCKHLLAAHRDHAQRHTP
ncbi:SWIM zinc finger family protein [Corynebacterium aquilae]|uniref:SWIM-type domain-containing protein n=1 Tax=Corynebacterium aquilae DSM 44791 TaxID=1431546 RepID=A0A1L7CES4_9CORY|nr:SWIM zinc finger family protein [Corynebacterium aquilae]APT84273.1 hypothetical protein CAQU_03410 [Corynebacterium aquilae DSM 44791]